MPEALDLTRLDRIVAAVATQRAAAIEAMLKAYRTAAFKHCDAWAAEFPILAGNGGNAFDGTEQLDLCCGVCQTPVARLYFAVSLRVDEDPKPQALGIAATAMGPVRA
jgi:hypothetical protein